MTGAVVVLRRFVDGGRGVWMVKGLVPATNLVLFDGNFNLCRLEVGRNKLCYGLAHRQIRDHLTFALDIQNHTEIAHGRAPANRSDHPPSLIMNAHLRRHIPVTLKIVLRQGHIPIRWLRYALTVVPSFGGQRIRRRQHDARITLSWPLPPAKPRCRDQAPK